MEIKPQSQIVFKLQNVLSTHFFIYLFIHNKEIYS